VVRSCSPFTWPCSLPDTFAYPEDSLRVPLPRGSRAARLPRANIPISVMIGVRYLVNPALRLAGDGVGKPTCARSNVSASNSPTTVFSSACSAAKTSTSWCVYARKFANLMPFGCWWFLNNPSIVEEMTRERLEMLGTSFIPQHSDARVLEQVIYKWRNTRRTLGPILANSYQLLSEDGRPRDARRHPA
jgi:hypothetical protein